jgi:hypothetical protein
MENTEKHGPSRRAFLQTGAAAATLGVLGASQSAIAQPASTWNQGELIHLIPTANHERFLIKASFKSPLAAKPRLSVDGRSVEGVQTDPQGRFWRFDVSSLRPATEYQLRITDPGGGPLCDAWPLKTFPAPAASTERLRVLAYTCGGGYDGPPFAGKTYFLDMAARRKLLDRGLSFEPDVLIANGDQIYWDQQTTLNKGAMGEHTKNTFWPKFGGAPDLSVPMLHPKNAPIFTAVCDYQITGLYGTTLRSTPAFFLTDDHDNFENDEFDDTVATLPPDTYGTLGAEQTQRLYYPEFLPDQNRPVWLPGGDKNWAPSGTNITFGTLRYGNLLEAVLYDCRRYVDYKGDHAKILPQWTEDWLIARTRAEDTAFFFHAPSLPFAYSSGKLGDWYPDLLDKKTGQLVVYEAKPGWQRGWFAQHQRLLGALASQKRRAPVIVQGDFHATGVGRMIRSGEIALDQPVHAVLAGTLGTGDLVFPSSFRAVESKPSQLVGVEEVLKPTEKNGFSIIDVTPDKMTFTLFMWRPPQPVEEIDTMKPALVYEVPRKA